jgi:hypothetical protein
MTTFDKLIALAKAVVADERINPAVRKDAQDALDSLERDGEVQAAARRGFDGTTPNTLGGKAPHA